MGCFVFILMITLAVATTNPVDDLSYDEIVNTFNSLKEEIKQLTEENIVLHGKYNAVHELSNKLQLQNIRHQNSKKKLRNKLQETKTSLDEATINNNALQSSNEQLEKELQNTKTTLDEATTNNNALQSSNEQCETELQNTKTTLDEATINNNALQSSNEQLEKELQNTKTTLEEATTYMPKDCTELYSNGFTSEGVYTIKPENSKPLSVYCQQGWTVIQKRSDDSVNYTKNMEEYGRGFGQIDGEHWLGLNAMNKLTEQGSYTLRFELEAFDGETAWAEYSNFHVSPGTDYTLTFDKSSYRGTAGDSLSFQHNMKFTTYDVEQDEYLHGSCSTDWGGDNNQFGSCGWWFNSCSHATTTAMEYRSYLSIQWNDFRGGGEGLKAAVMKIKRV